MNIIELQNRPTIVDKNVVVAYTKFENLLTLLKEKTLTEEIVKVINNEIDIINEVSDSDKLIKKQLAKGQSIILKQLEKQLKLVTKSHYQNMWLALGMVTFGVPIGVAIGGSSGNMGFIGIGLPLGMIIGMLVGASFDKKALEEGKQLDIEL